MLDNGITSLRKAGRAPIRKMYFQGLPQLETGIPQTLANRPGTAQPSP